jgi:hypothetical protein
MAMDEAENDAAATPMPPALAIWLIQQAWCVALKDGTRSEPVGVVPCYKRHQKKLL